MLRNPVLYVELKSLINNFQLFFSFMNIFTSIRLKMFFKIGALKILPIF